MRNTWNTQIIASECSFHIRKAKLFHLCNVARCLQSSVCTNITFDQEYIIREESIERSIWSVYKCSESNVTSRLAHVTKPSR